MARRCISDAVLTAPKPLYALVLLLFAGVLLIEQGVTGGLFHSFDHSLSGKLNMHVDVSSPTLISFIQAVSWVGGGVRRYIMLILLAAIIWRLKDRWHALNLAVFSLLAFLATSLLKKFFARERPDLVPHLDHASSFAFPSGHTNSVTVMFLLLIFLAGDKMHPLWRAAAIGFVLLSGVARIMLGVHWPMDVLCGFMLGGGFAILGYAAMQSAQSKAQVIK